MLASPNCLALRISSSECLLTSVPPLPPPLFPLLWFLQNAKSFIWLFSFALRLMHFVFTTELNNDGKYERLKAHQPVTASISGLSVVRSVTGSSPDSTHYFLPLQFTSYCIRSLSKWYLLVVLRTRHWCKEKDKICMYSLLTLHNC